ncbi:MAG: hypothetical protein ACLPKB_15980 [Xanthobacteraceae bacterium]
MPWISVSTDEGPNALNILDELQHDSDRTAGIVGAVVVEESLTKLLQSRLEPDQDFIRELFRASGPLGPFSVKINMGYLMGLYSKTARKELDTIKEIRNEFAHRVARSFAFERIGALANNLSLSETIEFHMAVESLEIGQQGFMWLGSKPPPNEDSVPILPPITADKLAPRERYIRACNFFSAAFLVLEQTPRASPNLLF